MPQVRTGSTVKGIVAMALFVAMAVSGTASLTALRTSVWRSERQAADLDRQIDQLSEQLRDAERTLTALTAPMGMYARAEEDFGMKRVSLAGVVRPDMPADTSVLSAALPGSGNVN